MPVLKPIELGIPAGMLKIDDLMCYGNTGSRIVLFLMANPPQIIFDNTAGGITVLKTSHLGVFDLELDVPGMAVPIWTWTGRKYELRKGKEAALRKPTGPAMADAPMNGAASRVKPAMRLATLLARALRG